MSFHNHDTQDYNGMKNSGTRPRSTDRGSSSITALADAVKEPQRAKATPLDTYLVKNSFAFGYTAFLKHNLVCIERHPEGGLKRVFKGDQHQYMLDEETIKEEFLPNLTKTDQF